MADHRIGKIYIELDLDPSRYMKGQQTLLKEAQHGATVLEKNFKNLGIRSGAAFDLMRQRAVKSFEAIKKSGQATANDRIRAEQAMANKIRQINAQQYGHTTSMLTNLKKHWLAMSAVAVTALYAIKRAVYASLDAYAIFDKGLIGIQKTTNMTDKQMVAMGASIRDLASYVPVSTEGLLEIAEAAGQLGVTGVKNVTLFTETMAKMQITSDVVGSEGAKSLARLLVTAGESADQIKILGSVIVSLGNQMETSESEIVEMASEIGRGTTAFNVSSASVAAYAAALKAMGAKAEGAGTAITKSMIMIEKAILKGGNRFLYLQQVTGMTGETIKRVFKEDSAKVFNAFIRGVHRMTKNNKSAITILDKFGLTGIRTIKSLTPLIKNIEQLNEAFRIAGKEVANATALDIEAMRASQSFSAQMQMTKNVIDEIASGIGKGLAPKIIEVTQDFRDWVNQNQEFIEQDLPKKIGEIATKTKEVIDETGRLFNKLSALINLAPSGMFAAGGAGVVARIISGSTPIGVLVGSLVLLNEQLAIFNANLGALSGKGSELNKYLANIWDVIIGKKDWHTGVMKNVEDLSTAFVELHTAQGSIWVERGDMDAYLNSLIDGTEDASENVKNLGDDGAGAFAAMELAAKEANKELKKYYKELDKHKAATDKVALAALPKYERALESIRRKYDELNKSLDKHGVLAGKTTEEIARLHKDLYERMMDDVEDFAASFAKDVRGNVEETKKTTDKIHDTWKHMYERLQDITADWIYNMKVDFDSLVDLFKRTVAEMISAWIWGQQSMQFASGQGGFSLGNMFGGIFGGGGRSDDVDVNVVNQSSGNNGINVAQGASSAWSLKGAYGAYQGAGGGWAGAKAGASSFFGGGGTAQLSLYAAAAIAAYNLYRSHRDDYESYYSTGASKYAPAPSWLQNTDYGFAKDAWGFTSDFSLAGVLAKALGFGNKKRSYLTREYEYGYDLETGWSETGMEETKEKRKGEEFRKSAEAMSDALVKMLNTIDEAVSSFLDSIDKTWADKWKTAMIDFGDLGFVFKISAEDKKEFKEDWKKSFSAALEGVINPVLEKATELMLEAFTGEIESSRLQAAKEILKDSVQGYLDDSIASVYEAFNAELPTSYKEFETYMENLGVGMEDAAAVLEYLNVIADIMDQISLVIELHGESDALKSATQTLIGINVQFRTFAEELSAVGVDLAKYPELLQAWHIAITESVEAMSSAGMSGEDLAKAIQYMADEMEEAGHSIEEVGEAVHAATMGIMDSIDELYKRHNEFRKTQAEILSEKYGFDFTGWTFEDWAAHNQQMYEDFLAQYDTQGGIQDWADYWASMGWTVEMLQDWRNFGAYLEDLWETAVSSGEAFATSVGDAGRDFADMVKASGEGLGSGASPEPTEMQYGAIVTRPTYSLIGEAGYPEVVLPLGGGHKLKAQLEGDKSQEITVTIPLTIVTEDGKILKQETVKETLGQIKERSRRREFIIHSTGVR